MPGSGLGLAIVKQVVVKHGGALRVDDTVPGGQPPGTAIHMVLPGRPVHATRPTDIVDEPPVSTENGGRKALTNFLTASARRGEGKSGNVSNDL